MSQRDKSEFAHDRRLSLNRNTDVPVLRDAFGEHFTEGDNDAPVILS